MSTPTLSGTTLPPETVEAFKRERAKGRTYQDIADEFSYSHETVRRIVGDTAETSWAQQRREARARHVAEMTEWLEKYGPVTRDMVREHWGLSDDQLSRLIADGVPGHLIMIASRDTSLIYSREHIVDAVQRAWAVEQRVNTDAEGLAYTKYEENRSDSDPTAPLIVSRYGWADICKEAGVPHGTRPSYLAGFTSRWSDDDLLDHVAAFVDECKAEKVKPGASAYAAWSDNRDDIPSLSTVRNRMRQQALESWPEVVLAAVNR